MMNNLVGAVLLTLSMLPNKCIGNSTQSGILSFDLNVSSGLPARGRSLDEADIQNAYNKYYYLSLFVGSNREEIQFLVDTGSSWLWIPSQECTTCNPTRLNSRFDKFSNNYYSSGFI
jgi:hypothetical protein